jgi:hypothetical protein
MTLVVTVNGPETIWVLADRRISWDDGRPPRDDARKIMLLDTPDSAALLGYAGLGETPGGVEPADWMSAVLRGSNLPLERMLDVLVAAAVRRLPPHLLNFRPDRRSHHILATSFVNGVPRIFTFSITVSPDGAKARWDFHQRVGKKTGKAPLFGILGSSSFRLNKNRQWMQPLLKLRKASDSGEASPRDVADHLAQLNFRVHGDDPSVGPNSIVVWRNRQGGPHHDGGAQQAYLGTAKDPAPINPPLPHIGVGNDIREIVEDMASFLFAAAAATPPGQPIKIDDKALEERLRAAKPKGPDETLK